MFHSRLVLFLDVRDDDQGEKFTGSTGTYTKWVNQIGAYYAVASETVTHNVYMKFSDSGQSNIF